MSKKDFESKVHNSFICAREGEIIFTVVNDKVLASLDGYVVMPYEQFNKLVKPEDQFIPDKQPCTEQTK